MQFKRTLLFLYLLHLTFLPLQAFASYRVGGLLGLGGTGIQSTTQINNTEILVERSEDPGVFRVFTEMLLFENITLGADFTKGFTLSPFSSGVGFLGITSRYYYPGLPPGKVDRNTLESSFFIKELSPFAGVSVGLASGTISRKNDLVSSISAAAIFGGIHLGFDYQIQNQLAFRFEFFAGSTPPAGGFVEEGLTAFALTSGLYYMF